MTNENRISDKRIGLRYLMMLSILLVIAEVLYIFAAKPDIEGTIMKVIFAGIPLIFVYLGKTWAKWIVSIALVLYGVIPIVIFFFMNSTIIWVVSLFNIFFGVILQLSPKIKAIFQDSTDTTNENIEIKTNRFEKLDYPYLLTRIKASMIDGGILLGLLAILSFINQNADTRPIVAIIFVIIAILYEPLMLQFFSATLGHRLMGIEVKNVNDTKRNINVIQGLIRIIIKFLLGWLSFITINFNSGHRAIHDYLSSSIVLKNE